MSGAENTAAAAAPPAEPTWPRCRQCRGFHPPTFNWRDRERTWHENVPEPRGSVRR